MKHFILNDPFNNQMLKTPDNVLESPNVDGVSINLELQAFMMGGSDFGGIIPDLKKEIKRIAPSGKKIKLAVMAGNSARNIPGVRYVTVIEAHGEGAGKKQSISVPVPWDANYLTYMESFIKWLADQLKADPVVWDALYAIVLAWNNQLTCENKTPDQDMTTGDFYFNAAVKWKAEGYTPQKIKDAMVRVQKCFLENFTGKILIFPIIKGLNGVPCIDKNGEICVKGKRPKTDEELCTEIAQPAGVMCGWCYMNQTSIAPDYLKAYPAFYQMQNKTPATELDMFKIFINAGNQNCGIFETQGAIYEKYPF